MRTISPTATPLPTAYDCVAVYIAGRRTNLVGRKIDFLKCMWIWSYFIQMDETK